MSTISSYIPVSKPKTENYFKKFHDLKANDSSVKYLKYQNPKKNKKFWMGRQMV
jgi:hypothetical protein